MRRFLYWLSHTTAVVLGMIGMPLVLIFLGVGFGLISR
jgi:hypothetical protein